MRVLLTTGATAPFPTLLHAALTPAFLTTLASLGYTHLTLQTSTSTPVLPTSPPVEIDTFDFASDLTPYIVAADLVITHAGAGTVLECMRYAKKLVVVPNAALMDGHQKELAVEVEKGGWGVMGVVEGEGVGLEEAVKRVEVLGVGAGWREGGRGVADEVEAELGLVVE